MQSGEIVFGMWLIMNIGVFDQLVTGASEKFTHDNPPM